MIRDVYTGYLKRLPERIAEEELFESTPYLLVTPGGGRDGNDLVDLVIDTYRHYPNLPYHALIVLGPFMHADDRQRFHQLAETMENVTLLDFHPRMESLITGAEGMITMGGYNTFCEILSFDKPALLFPRTTPRTEQLIRCQRADALGMLKVLDPDTTTPQNLGQWIRNFESLPRPSRHFLPGMLEGMNTISQRIQDLLPGDRIRPVAPPRKQSHIRAIN